MPKSQSTHTVETTLTLELAEVGETVEIPARVSFTYHPGDSGPVRLDAIDPPDPELVEDVRIEVKLGGEDSPVQWRRIKDSTLEARLFYGLIPDLAGWAQEQRQAEYEVAMEPRD